MSTETIPTVKGFNISEEMVIDFGGAPAIFQEDKVVQVHLATVDYVEAEDGLGGPGLHVVPVDGEAMGWCVYVDLDESADYPIHG